MCVSEICETIIIIIIFVKVVFVRLYWKSFVIQVIVNGLRLVLVRLLKSFEISTTFLQSCFCEIDRF